MLKKKLKRGLNMDISDVINVAMVFNKAEGYATDEWINAWEAFEESANTRGKRITSNLISLCRYSFAIADYLEKVSNDARKKNSSKAVKVLASDGRIRRALIELRKNQDFSPYTSTH